MGCNSFSFQSLYISSRTCCEIKLLSALRASNSFATAVLADGSSKLCNSGCTTSFTHGLCHYIFADAPCAGAHLDNKCDPIATNNGGLEPGDYRGIGFQAILSGSLHIISQDHGRTDMAQYTVVPTQTQGTGKFPCISETFPTS